MGTKLYNLRHSLKHQRKYILKPPRERVADSDLYPVPYFATITKDSTAEHKELFAKNYRRFRSTIKKLAYQIDRHNREDLMQFGAMSLWTATVEFGDKLNNGLAFVRIKRSMLATSCEYNRQEKFIQRPKTTRKYRKAIKTYKDKHGIDPTAEQLAKILNVHVNRVREFLIRQNHIFYTHEEHSDFSKKASIRNPCPYVQRARELEDKYIYFIDRFWVKGMIKRLPSRYQEGAYCYMSDETVKEWATRTGNQIRSGYRDRQGAIKLLRELADLRVKLNDPVCPMQLLIEKYGMPISSLVQKKNLPKVVA